MKTNHQTTFILLERGTEDVRLEQEISQLLLRHRISTKDAAKDYPTLLELKQRLWDQVKEQMYD